MQGTDNSSPDHEEKLYEGTLRLNEVERKLKQQEGQIKLLMDSTMEGIYGIDLEGKCTFVNTTCLSLLRYKTAEELVGKKIISLIHSSDSSDSSTLKKTCQIDSALKENSGGNVDDELMRRADGTSFQAEYWFHPIKKGKERIGTVVTFVDITERKKMETELLKQRHDLGVRLRELHCLYNTIKVMNNSSVPFDETMQMITEVVADSLQFPEITCCRIVYRDKEYKTGNFQNTPWNISADFILTNKRVGKLEVYYLEEMPPSDEGPFQTEEMEMVSSLAETITQFIERTEALKDLMEKEEVKQLILDTTQDAFVMVDESARICDWNYSAVKMFGKSYSEVMGKDIYETIFPSKKHEESRELLKRFIDSDEAQIIENLCETTVLGKNGKELPVELSISYAQTEKNKRLLHAFIKDISGRKTLERQIRQSQKMEAIGTLAGGIAHDFNNILTTIIGFSELVKDSLLPESNEAKNLQFVLDSSYRAKDLVTQILSFSRLSTEEKSSMQLIPLIKESVKLFRSSFPKNITIQQRIDNDCRLIYGNVTQIHQIIMNLCTNATHAMKDGGVLEIALENFHADPKFSSRYKDMEAGDYVRLTVKDSGSGIPPEIHDRIFEPFFTTKPPGVGTGLGLSVVHGIVREHKGVIDFESKPGQGTTFTLFFPIYNTEIVQRFSLPMGNERILLVDEEQPYVAQITERLHSLGYQVAPYTDSRAALEAFQSKTDAFDLLITGFTMSGMGGDVFINEVHSFSPGLPVILMAGYSELGMGKELLDCNITEFLTKPCEKEVLAKTIRKALPYPPKKG